MARHIWGTGSRNISILTSSANYSNDNIHKTEGKRGFGSSEKSPFNDGVYVANIWKILFKDIIRYIPISALAFVLLACFLRLGLIPQIVAIFIDSKAFNVMFVINVLLTVFLAFVTFWFPFIILRKYFRQKKINQKILLQKQTQEKSLMGKG